MEKEQIFRDITERTGGEIYLGVVGPVRTGKSTFIKKFIETLVLPRIKNPKERDRARDEMPQSGAGRTIMTSEPKFVPQEALEMEIKEGVAPKIRLVDCVGYTVAGALGYETDGAPRMVRTPWQEDEIPFQDAAEFGTQKVISEHSTIGIVVFTDGSITDIPRENYLEAEERVVWELKSLDKPFLIILNSVHPDSPATKELAAELEATYEVPVLPFNVFQMDEEDFMIVLEEALYEFPVAEVNVILPRWVDQLEEEHWLKKSFTGIVEEAIQDIKRLRDVDVSLEKMADNDFTKSVRLRNMDLGSGSANIEMATTDGLFYRVLEELTGFSIDGEHTLLKLMRELSGVKKDYDKVAAGLAQVRSTGYGMVLPSMDELELMEPELIRQGGRFGVKLKANAPSYHLIRADITTEITPLIGTEKQCEELVDFIMNEFEDNPQALWETNIFGKSLHDLVREGIQGKLYHMPENAQVKLQETLERIVNEGGGGLICIII